MVGELNKTVQKLLSRETKARKELDKKLAMQTVKNAEAHNPGKKYRAIPVEKGPYTEYIPAITGEKAWKYSFLSPAKNHKNYEKQKGNFNDPKWLISLAVTFEELITKLKIIQGEKIAPRASAKELKNFKKSMEDLRWELHKLDKGLEFGELAEELVFSIYTVNKLIEKRQAKMKSSKYSDEIVKITRHLVGWWCGVTGDKSINAYSKGNTYDRSLMRDPSAKKNLKTIDVKYNPGGAFIQRTLKTYFNLTLDNTQLKTLLKKALSKK